MDNNEKKPSRGGGHLPTAGNIKPNARQKAKANKPKVLTLMEETFCDLVMTGLSHTKACAQAGYSAKTAHSTGSALLKKPHIAARLAELMEKQKEDLRVTHEQITAELTRIAFADMTEFVELVNVPDGKGGFNQELKFKPTCVTVPGMGKIIKSFKIGRGGKIELTIHSKEQALDMLAKHTNYYDAHNKSAAAPAAQIYIPDNGRDVKTDGNG